MMEQQYSEQNQVDMEVCEVSYFIIHSISTQYVNFGDKSLDSTKTNDNVTLALKNMELMESDKKKNEKNIKEKNYSANTKQINNVKQLKIVPTLSRWHKTFNIAQEILKPGSTDRPTHTNIAIQFLETYTNVTYLELLCKIAESKVDFQLKDGAIHIKRRNETLQVPIDNFHSYLQQENDIYCILCHMTFSKTEADIHKYEVRHMNHVVKIIDYCGFRRVNCSYSHCIVCNLRVQNKKEAKVHVKKSHHITRHLSTKQQGY